MIDQGQSKNKIRIFLFGISAIGLLMLLWANKNGMGINPDSAHYIDCAENLAKGKGYSTFLYNIYNPISIKDYVQESAQEHTTSTRAETHFPPLFSICIAFFRFMGMDSIRAAQWLVFILFGCNIFLVGILASRFFGQTSYFSLIAALFMLSPVMLDAHSHALSEAQFIFLSLLGLYSFIRHIDSGKKSTLIMASIWIGLASLTRYIGIALIISGVAYLLLSKPKNNAKKLSNTLVFSIISLLPLAIFLVRNYFLAHNIINRTILVQPVPFVETLKALSRALSNWIFPGADKLVLLPGQSLITSTIALALAIVFFALSFILLFRTKKQEHQETSLWDKKHILVIFFLYIFSYVGLLFLTIHFGDRLAVTQMDRMLTPIFGLSIILGLYVFTREGYFFKGRTINIIKKVAIVCCLATMVAGLAWASISRNRGLGYHNRFWQSVENKEAFSILNKIPSSVPIYSNDYASVYFFSHRYAYSLPFENYYGKFEKLKQTIGNARAILLIIKSEAHGLAIKKHSKVPLPQIARYFMKEKQVEVLFHSANITLLQIFPSSSTSPP